ILVLLLFLPSLIYAENCGNCDGVWEQIAREKQMDEDYHGCRSCLSEITRSKDACPPKGYDCSEEWPLTTNVLTPEEGCRCSEVTCAGKAKLAVNGEIVASKIRCNNSEWTTKGEQLVDPVVCAKSCEKGVCSDGNSRANSKDFRPLKVARADDQNSCAIGTCMPDNGMAIINDNGTPVGPLTDVTKVTCTGDGEWKAEDDERYKYVMCNISPCGPGKCPAFVDGPGMADGVVKPLQIKSNEGSCATATCPPGSDFVEMSADGDVLKILSTGELTCQNTGVWLTDSAFDVPYVMCSSCQSGCNSFPFSTTKFTADGSLMTLEPAIRGVCSYSCPTDNN
ncbi:hypothetical protein PMAYCL1PPCAC_10801, partial [Pristionchus mayeri]